jgi:hypothetical protein
VLLGVAACERALLGARLREFLEGGRDLLGSAHGRDRFEQHDGYALGRVAGEHAGHCLQVAAELIPLGPDIQIRTREGVLLRAFARLGVAGRGERIGPLEEELELGLRRLESSPGGGELGAEQALQLLRLCPFQLAREPDRLLGDPVQRCGQGRRVGAAQLETQEISVLEHLELKVLAELPRGVPQPDEREADSPARSEIGPRWRPDEARGLADRLAYGDALDDVVVSPKRERSARPAHPQLVLAGAELLAHLEVLEQRPRVGVGGLNVQA